MRNEFPETYGKPTAVYISELVQQLATLKAENEKLTEQLRRLNGDNRVEFTCHAPDGSVEQVLIDVWHDAEIGEDILTPFAHLKINETKMRQRIYAFDKLDADNDRLRSALVEREKEVRQLKADNYNISAQDAIVEKQLRARIAELEKLLSSAKSALSEAVRTGKVGWIQETALKEP